MFFSDLPGTSWRRLPRNATIMQKTALCRGEECAHNRRLYGTCFVEYLTVWGVEQVVTLVTSCLESTGVWLKGMTVHRAHQLMSLVLSAQLALPSAA